MDQRKRAEGRGGCKSFEGSGQNKRVEWWCQWSSITVGSVLIVTMLHLINVDRFYVAI